MKVLQINTVYGKGSTGKIAKEIHDACVKANVECKTAYRYREATTPAFEDTMVVSSWLDCHIHNRLSRYTLLQGCFSYVRTKSFIRKVKKYSPDVIHLHNLHGSYINFKVLFSFLYEYRRPVVWTLHDCWSLTGYCPHYAMVKCDKWKFGCISCPHYKPEIPLLPDTVSWLWTQKKALICGINNLTLVTPSKWLNDQVGMSYLKNCNTRVITHGIDLDVFKPTSSEFRKKYHIPPHKHILLGVAFGWNERKGLDVFLDLAKRLDHNEYQIVLVGTTPEVEKILPENIISINRTNNQTELSEIYSAADLFVNPTREEMFGLVNVEATACGTPVLTFRTGGCPECIDELSGAIVDCDDIDAMEKEIIRICTQKPFSKEHCMENAKRFDLSDRFTEYVELYISLAENRNTKL